MMDGETASRTPSGVPFFQTYKSQVPALSALIREAPTAHLLLYALLVRMNRRNALVASRRMLATILGMSMATVTRAMKVLRERHFVEVLRSGNAMVIVVNQRVAWTDDSALRGKVAVFDARVLVSAEEQERADRLGREPPLEHVSVGGDAGPKMVGLGAERFVRRPRKLRVLDGGLASSRQAGNGNGR